MFHFLICSCNGQATKNTESISPKAFSEKINATTNPQIIDVRTPKEFASEHIDDAKNVNWNAADFVTKANEYNKLEPVFVYCLSGGRSKQAAQKLEELGFKTIYELDGGIMKWNAAGFSKPSDKIIGMSVEDYQKLLLSDKKILINFYADWCAPCKIMAPYVSKMQKDLKDNVTIIRLNADENKTLIASLKINTLPTLLLYENNKVTWTHSGLISELDLKKQLQ